MYFNTQLPHPSPSHAFKLWQIFLDNVDPLTKIIHAPTFQQQTITSSDNTENIPRPLEALLFSIYSLSIVSLSASECFDKFGESKAVLSARYQSAARQALSKANFLRTSDMETLQAFVFYLLTLRVKADSETLWSLTGIAVRIAQRIGIHRDGTTHGLPLFQVELRRRLWWQIIMLDGRAGELTGTGSSLIAQLADAQKPLNLNDSDLSPGMERFPREHKGPTQMSFPLLRVEVWTFLKEVSSDRQTDHFWSRLTGEKLSQAEKDKAIDQLEARFEENYMRNFDPSIPVHFLTSHVAGVVICKMRWTAHNPRQTAQGGKAQVSPEESEKLFDNALKIMDFENITRSNPATRRFYWHSNSQTQWDAYIYVMSELRHRTSGEKVERAWRAMEQTTVHRPEIIAEKKPLHVAIGNVTLAAWDAYQAATKDPNMVVPQFIHTLRAQRMPKTSPRELAAFPDNSIPNAAFPTPQTYTTQNLENYPVPFDQAWQNYPIPFDPASEALNPMDWSDWDTLIHGVDAYNATGGGQYMLPL